MKIVVGILSAMVVASIMMYFKAGGFITGWVSCTTYDFARTFYEFKFNNKTKEL